MIYLFCSIPLKAAGARLHATLRGHLEHESIHLVPSIDDLRQQLSHPQTDRTPGVVVFITASLVELRLLQEQKELLTTIPLVLLIKEQSDENIALAHSLFPRFLCCLDDDYLMVTKVIENILINKAA